MSNVPGGINSEFVTARTRLVPGWRPSTGLGASGSSRHSPNGLLSLPVMRAFSRTALSTRGSKRHSPGSSRLPVVLGFLETAGATSGSVCSGPPFRRRGGDMRRASTISCGRSRRICGQVWTLLMRHVLTRNAQMPSPTASTRRTCGSGRWARGGGGLRTTHRRYRDFGTSILGRAPLTG